MKTNKMTSDEMERLFDNGDEKYLDYFDLHTAHRENQEPHKIHISLPAWMVESLDREADRIGVTRQAVIKTWIDEKLQGLSMQ
jgi:hypothetical protein